MFRRAEKLNLDRNDEQVSKNLQSPWKKRGKSFQAGGAEGEGDCEHRGQGGHAGARGWKGLQFSKERGKENSEKSRKQSSSQESIWGKEGNNMGEDLNKDQRSSDSDSSDNAGKESQQQYTILYGNVRSILNKLLEFKALVYDIKPSIVMLCETFARSDMLKSLQGECRC